MTRDAFKEVFSLLHRATGVIIQESLANKTTKEIFDIVPCVAYEKPIYDFICSTALMVDILPCDYKSYVGYEQMIRLVNVMGNWERVIIKLEKNQP